MPERDWRAVGLGTVFPAGGRPRRRAITHARIGPAIKVMCLGDDGDLYLEAGTIGELVEVE